MHSMQFVLRSKLNFISPGLSNKCFLNLNFPKYRLQKKKFSLQTGLVQFPRFKDHKYKQNLSDQLNVTNIMSQDLVLVSTSPVFFSRNKSLSLTSRVCHLELLKVFKLELLEFFEFMITHLKTIETEATGLLDCCLTSGFSYPFIDFTQHLVRSKERHESTV